MMSNLIEDLEDLLDDDVNGRGAKVKRIKKITQNAPEVMVKITGYTKGNWHMQSHLNYIARWGDLELEDEEGHIINTKDGFDNLVKEWSEVPKKGNKNTRTTTNIILSMPSSVEADDIKNSVRHFAKKTFGENHQYVMALHEDTDNPHVHLTVKNLGYDGRRLQIKNGDPQKWREDFVKSLELEGVEAEATPRAVRGVVQRGEKQSLINMRERGIIPETDRSKTKEAFDMVRQSKNGKITRDYPWNNKIIEKQKSVRAGWLKVADKLKESDIQEDKKLSENVKSFVKNMPAVETERHVLYKRASSVIQQQENKRKEIEIDDEFER